MEDNQVADSWDSETNFFITHIQKRNAGSWVPPAFSSMLPHSDHLGHPTWPSHWRHLLSWNNPSLVPKWVKGRDKRGCNHLSLKSPRQQGAQKHKGVHLLLKQGTVKSNVLWLTKMQYWYRVMIFFSFNANSDFFVFLKSQSFFLFLNSWE